MPAFFGSAKKDNGLAANAPPQEPVAAGGKAQGNLADLIDESVAETALLLFREAPSFAADVNGTEMPVGLLLSVEQIGGLDKKSSRKDPDKGQMLQCIRNDEIQVYATPDMLAQGKILFIPTQKTLSNMDEYSFLRQASYGLVAVDASGSLHPLEKEISFIDAVKVDSGEAQMSSFTGSGRPSAFSREAAEQENAVPIPSAPSALDNFHAEEVSESLFGDADFGSDDDAPFDGEYEPDDEVSGLEPELDIDFDDIPDAGFDAPAADDTDYSNGFDEEEQESEYEEEEGEPVYEEDIEEEQVMAAVSRRFYSDELGLEVSNEPFDAQFMRDNPVPAFSEDYDDQWLNGYLRQMARDANLELARMHQNNIARLRENYFNLMARRCEDIQRTLDISSPDTTYGKKLHTLDSKRTEFLDMLMKEAEKSRDKLNEEYEVKKKQYVDNAAAAASQQFENMYGRSHSNQIAQLEPAAYDRAESQYQDMRRNILSERRGMAGKLLDYSISDIMKILTDEYRKRLEEEEKRFSEIKASMQQFLDENRKDEVARVRVLAEELERDNQVERAAAEYKARMDALLEEHEAKKRALEQEVEEVRRAGAAALQRKEDEAARRVANAGREADELRTQLTEANQRYYELDEKKDREYEKRMSQLREDNLMLAEKMGNIVEAHKKSNTISTFLVVAILVAALAIGFIVGTWVRSTYSVSGSGNAIVEEYQRRLDELEEKYGYQAPAESSAPNAQGN